jgi:hypothetical protein
MTLSQLFVASLGLGVGMNVARWFIEQATATINTALKVLFDRKMRERVMFSVCCPMCGGHVDTILRCSSPTCGYVHEPSAEPAEAKS